MISFTLIAVIVSAVAFDIINGFHDTANAIATSVSTRVLSLKQAVIMAAGLNFLGAMVNESVAKTIEGGIVDGYLEQYVIVAAILSAIIWDLITWYFGIPCSSSHALIGGLIGASIVYSYSLHIVVWKGVLDKVIIPLFTSPILGFFIGYVIMTLLYKILKPFSLRHVNKWFSKLQICSAAFMAYSHGSNDAQKSMGIITLALISAGLLDKNHGVPTWVKLLCALAMAIGTSIGGRRIIKTIGDNMIKLKPINGFAAETGAAIVIQTMTALGAPVSTTQVISSSIMGVGSSKRFSAVNWGVVKNMLIAWLVTIPATVLLGAVITFIIKLFMH